MRAAPARFVTDKITFLNGKKMNRLNELIAKTTLELLQSVLPTNIMTNLEQLDAGIESEFTNDLDVDTDRLLFEHFLRLRTQPMDKSQATTAPYAFQEPHFVAVSELNDNGEQNDNNSSLTYFEIVEQEMMRSVPVTKDNIMVHTHYEYFTDSVFLYSVFHLFIKM